ncbi:MAG: hypothetical protein AAGG08_03200 [Actinomycetota bacterium]
MRGADFSGTNTVEAAIGHTHDPTTVAEARRAQFDEAFASGATIAVGANASRSLVDALKSTGRHPRFVPLDAWSAPIPGDAVDGLVLGSISGQIPPLETTLPVVIDVGDGGVTTAASAPIDHDALARVHGDIAIGIRAAAGFDTLPSRRADHSLLTGVVVRLPGPADPTAFFAYASGEGTGIEWLATRQPLHPHARQHLTRSDLERSSHHLARLFHVPVGDRFTTEEVDHAVLGVVKAAEYLGWRWWQDPDLVDDYALFLDAEYGPDHEAFRPAFRDDRSGASG